jgi:25S rRNA (uracil2634-N3)-methyltransferase
MASLICENFSSNSENFRTARSSWGNGTIAFQKIMDALTSTIIAAKRIILSVGSGDGSQQAAIAKSGHHNIVSTFFDSEDKVTAKYPSSRGDITFLRSNSTVLFGVDAAKLHDHVLLKDKKFDIIIFTFPHTGIPNYAKGFGGPNPKSIEENKTLIRKFLASAQHILADDGEIIITLKTSAPYDKWTFPDFAQFEIEPKSQHSFNAKLFPGYTHRSTKGHVKSVENGHAKSYAFSRKRKQDNTTSCENASFCPSLPFKLSVEFSTVEDKDVELYVIELLALSETSNAQCNVLDIRRSFPEGIRPDTRQLNRVLYQMESSKLLKKGPPHGSNQKPTWQYIPK